MSKSVYVVGPAFHWMVSTLFTAWDYKVTDKIGEADIVCLTGGADISPELYADVKHPTTWPQMARDRHEVPIVYESIQKRQLVVGICRGAQLANALSGGDMYQDVNNHEGQDHDMVYYNADGTQENWIVSSAHHQMMKPSPSGLIWGVSQRSTYRDTGIDRRKPVDIEKDGLDVEVVFYPETRSYCFQGHPEFGPRSCEEIFFKGLERAWSM